MEGREHTASSFHVAIYNFTAQSTATVSSDTNTSEDTIDTYCLPHFELLLERT